MDWSFESQGMIQVGYIFTLPSLKFAWLQIYSQNSEKEQEKLVDSLFHSIPCPFLQRGTLQDQLLIDVNLVIVSFFHRQTLKAEHKYFLTRDTIEQYNLAHYCAKLDNKNDLSLSFCEITEKFAFQIAAFLQRNPHHLKSQNQKETISQRSEQKHPEGQFSPSQMKTREMEQNRQNLSDLFDFSQEKIFNSSNTPINSEDSFSFENWMDNHQNRNVPSFRAVTSQPCSDPSLSDLSSYSRNNLEPSFLLGILALQSDLQIKLQAKRLLKDGEDKIICRNLIFKNNGDLVGFADANNFTEIEIDLDMHHQVNMKIYLPVQVGREKMIIAKEFPGVLYHLEYESLEIMRLTIHPCLK